MKNCLIHTWYHLFPMASRMLDGWLLEMAIQTTLPLKETCNQLLACCFYSGFRSNELVQEASSNTVIFGGISKIYWYVQESVPETLCY